MTYTSAPNVPMEKAFTYDEGKYKLLSEKYLRLYEVFCGRDAETHRLENIGPMVGIMRSPGYTREERIELENQILAKHVTELGGNPEQVFEEFQKDAILLCLIGFGFEDMETKIEEMWEYKYFTEGKLEDLVGQIKATLKSIDFFGISGDYSDEKPCLSLGYRQILAIVEKYLSEGKVFGIQRNVAEAAQVQDYEI
jgi:hypothetical protein